MASFAGLRATDNFGTDERPKNFRELILWSNPNGRAPLFALMARMASQKTDDPEIAWFEEQQQIVRLKLNDGTDMSDSDTAFVVDEGALQLVVGDRIMIEKTELATYDNEIVAVTAVASDTAFTGTRGVSGTTAAIILDNADMTLIGNAFEEGSAKATIAARNPVKKNNFCQIFKTAIGITNTADATKFRTGDAFSNDKKRKTFHHSVAIEHALMWGVKNEDLTGTHPKRTMGGLREFITTNVKIYTTAVVEDDFLDNIYKVFDFQSGGAGDERIVFAGNGALNVLNKIARASNSTNINFTGTIDMFGMNVQKWVIPQGTLFVRTHPLMNVHPKFTNSMFIIDPTGIRWRFLRDTRLETDIHTPGTDARESQWLTEATLELHREETMGYLGNMT